MNDPDMKEAESEKDPKLLVDGRDLLIANTSEAFADLTVRVLSDPNLRISLGEHGRRSVQERYDWQAIGSQLSGFVEQIVRNQEKLHAPHIA